ncbi:DUF1513 domain-containing protein [uncultured Tateyamaria sp.]|uniref:DUF1513 domain-containing protein n=1 Tax=uncultured Tateyamaria sp. TaxID=455651 RepID=UPI00345A4326
METGHGIVGVWDARNGYKRVGAFASGGIGPHDIKLLPDAEVLAIANGGIETHPETGRTKLNIPTMRPNLTYATLDGQIMERIALSHDHHKNSIHHLAVTRDATAAFVMQWQGDLSDHAPLLGTHRLGQGGPALAKAEAFKGMQAYVGSVAAHRRSIAITSPRGGIFLEIDARDLALTHRMHMRDVCGVAPERDGFVCTDGTGRVFGTSTGAVTASHQIRWDNHLITL